jgi:serine/threonine protein kinase
MSPERLRGGTADPRADIFSAGAVLYEMACGRPPFNDPHPIRLIEAILNGKVPRPSQVNARIHPALETIILRALDPHPPRRFACASDLAKALETLVATSSARPTSLSSVVRWATRMAAILAW